jgi:Na+/serine symporter
MCILFNIAAETALDVVAVTAVIGGQKWNEEASSSRWHLWTAAFGAADTQLENVNIMDSGCNHSSNWLLLYVP